MTDFSSISSNGVKGNTRTLTHKKQIAPAKHWVFVLNNYTEDDIIAIKSLDSSIVPIIVFQKEVGEKCGTPHLQGTLTFKSKGRPFSLNLTNRISWGKKVPKSSVTQMREYACKKETRVEGSEIYFRGWEPPEELYIEPPNEHLKCVEDAMRNYEHGRGDRLINYVVDGVGGLGKTEFCRWAVNEFSDCIITGGKSADMKNQIVAYKETNNRVPRYILIDCPRSVLGYLSYTGIEEIKNMLFYSGKYEGAMICGNKPFICMFMNQLPELEKCSADRWNCLYSR